MAQIYQGCEYLGQFDLSRDHINIPDEVFRSLDSVIRNRIIYTNTQLENYLIAETEFLSTFTTAKAEQLNALSTSEAKKVIEKVAGSADTEAFIPQSKKFDIQEYKNIVQGFRKVCKSGLSASDLSIDRLKNLHHTLTDGLDQLNYGVGGSGAKYNSGELREGEVWIGDMYAPADPGYIEKELQAAITYFQNNQTIADAIIFSLAVYAIHPFNNGNKRVCRVMEHGLLRGLGMNKENMYSHITETYASLDRYKTTMQATLGRKVLNSFVNFQLESLYWTQMNTLRATVEYERREWINKIMRNETKKHLQELLDCLITAKALQYSEVKQMLNMINDKILSSLLNYCVEKKILLKKTRGHGSFYSLQYNSPVEADLIGFYLENENRVSYMPDQFMRSIVKHRDMFSNKE